MKITARTRAEIFLLSVTVIWGSTFVLTKFILESASPFVYLLLRFAIATILFVFLFPARLRLMNRQAVQRGAVLGILLFIGFALQTVGLKYTTASKSAFITGMMVVFTPILQLLIERRPPRFGNILGVLFVALGLFFLTSPQGSEFNIGDLMALGCAISFAIYIVYLDIIGREHDPVHLSFMQFISTLILSIPFLCTEHMALNFNSNFLSILLYLAIMPTIVALYIQAKYQKDTTPTRSAIIFSMEPPLAAIFAYALIGEVIGFWGILGGILILCGLIVSELSDIIFPPKKFRSS